jgi:hypothetical protein
MLFLHEAEAPPQTALADRADNAQIRGHVWQPCVLHKPARNKRCGKALVPALSSAPSPYAQAPMGWLSAFSSSTMSYFLHISS